jgi:hypothetical protein
MMVNQVFLTAVVLPFFFQCLMMDDEVEMCSKIPMAEKSYQAQPCRNDTTKPL